MATIIKTPAQWHTLRHSGTFKNKTIGYVATMGNLHAGHQASLHRARKENDIVILSIFVNPTQFDDQADFDNYPRTVTEDIATADACDCDYVFLPDYESMYPDDYRYQIRENSLSQGFEGECRPGHFEGVLTVVMKFFQIIKPTRAYFGEKDFQQYQLIKDMAASFFLETEIIGVATVRDESGLPLSSRNGRLNSEQFVLAQKFAQIFHGHNDCDIIRTEIAQLGIQVDYVKQAFNRLFIAVKIGDIRLIDNRAIEEAL